MGIFIGKRAMAVPALILIAMLIAPVSAPASDVAENLSNAIPFKTISYQDNSKVDKTEFLAFHKYLEKTYPHVHKTLEREKVNELGLLYKWTGSDPGLKPIILMAHQDVVPIDPATTEDWTHPPFFGQIADDYVWGRGTMDCKGFLIATLQAVEEMLAQGYQPRRTVYLAFGQDEEVGGWQGSAAISALLESRGVKAEMVIDEGGYIIDGSPLGVDKEVSLVGIAEKGYLSLELKVKSEDGHSSMPPPETAIGILSAAIYRLEKKPFPSHLEGVSVITLESLAPEMPPYMKFAIKSRWLIGGLIKKMLSEINATNAIIRTTTAPTIIEAGTKENVLPQEARAVVNFRLLPGDSIDYAIARVKKVINDPRVSVEPIGRPREASKVSSIESRGYEILKSTIAESFPDTLIAPFLVPGGTDARHYGNICDSVYRFAPMRLTEDDQVRAHGIDERIGVANLEEVVEFYKKIVVNSD